MSKKNNKNKNSGLGRQLIKNNNKKRREQPQILSTKHTTDIEPSKESILDQTDLDAIMNHAELTGKKFIAEKQNAVIISRNIVEVDDIDPKRIEEMEKHWNEITIPRRPNWKEVTTAEELKQLESNEFYKWRRGLAELEKNEHLLLTPFEKNIEVWRQLWRVVERSSLIVQIVDARNPLLFRSVDLEKWVTSMGKSTLLLVNKADYLTPTQRGHWANFFQSENIPFVFFSALTSEEEHHNPDDSLTRIYSRKELMELFIEKSKQPGPNNNNNNTGETESRYMVGMVGYPNVGKSSTINFLMEQKRVSVSKTPGKTKHLQTLLLPDLPITLCDCPGLVFPTFMSTKEEMICSGLIRISELKDIHGPISYICRKISKRTLEKLYHVKIPDPAPNEDPNRPPTSEELLTAYGYVRGYMTRHGVPDQARAGKLILQDFVDGKILYCNAPPGFTGEFHEEKEDSSEGEDTGEGEENNEENETNFDLDGINVKTFEITEAKNPNDFRRKEGGRKHQRRLKEKMRTENTTGVYYVGKNVKFDGGNRSLGSFLPTSIKFSAGGQIEVKVMDNQ